MDTEILNRQSVAAKVEPGSFIVYTDEVGQRHNAMVTTVHGTFYDSPAWTEEDVRSAYAKIHNDDEEAMREQAKRLIGAAHSVPCINLVYVVSDESKTDSYGRQIERKTSVQHRSQTTAHGFYWENV